MANDENLIPLNDRSKEDAKRIRSLGGKARAQQKKEQKQYESFQIASNRALDKIQAPTLENLANAIEKLSRKEDLTPTEMKAVTDGLQFLRDSSGQKPTDKQEITGDVSVMPTTFNILPVRGSDEL